MIYRYYFLGFLFLLLDSQTVAEEQQQTMPIASIWKSVPTSTWVYRAASIISPWLPQSLFANRYTNKAKQLFLDDVKNYADQNNYIPNKKKKTLRIMNFNVRMWTTINDKPNFDAVISVIKKLDPDIVILQEVTEWQKTYNAFVMMGYNTKAASCITKDPTFGVAIFAKNCEVKNTAASIFKHQRNPHRELCFVRLDAIINKKTISIYGTHLEVDQKETKELIEDVRAQQLQEILADAQHQNISSTIIAGDFNSVRPEDYQYIVNGINGWELLQRTINFQFKQELQPKVLDLIRQNNFRSSFELLKWQNPHFTNWTGRTVDFIFFSSDWKLPIGSYIYYTDVSDHLPIVVDMQL
jgi:endonuclease/exonuclease/phosphatase family metal-dependent hydrolase